MNSRPDVSDIQTYLRDSGWRQRPQSWHDASIWSHPDGYEVLVPPRDDLADAELRVREILSALTTVEGRSLDEIASDIKAPFDDIQVYRTRPDGLSDGSIPLTTGIRRLQCVRDLISAAARTVVEGPLAVFPRGIPAPVPGLLQHVRLGPGQPADHVFTIRVPLTTPEDPGPPQAGPLPFGRQVVRQLYTAVTAVHSAATQPAGADLAAFEEAVAVGGSANLCEALSGLAGRQYQQPFEVTFRWGRGLSSDIPARTIHFADGAGAVIRDAATQLRLRGISGVGVITGLVESLHGQALSDYWRIKVHGNLATRNGDEPNRTVWVRLDSQAAYDRAMAAHRSDQLVQARGELSAAKGPVELIVDGERFDIL